MYWQNQGQKEIVKKINKIIKDIDRHPFEGLGKPEPSQYNLSGKWSRRLNQEDSIIYMVDKGTIYIYSCKDHY
ncbi:Txe/YoeB family addiction module toxin [Limosilactobacillus albertensis]|uniref:Txe/YoeB family addiction module toxin n=1 Tax=Limosilactobacillus albertensis TaxID=2759752 RepID=UPI001E442540|nr:Txe/YoeB family addiction module toxin [Limosilactobacillus albertensis]MCD7118291.1 Txe/YoeB family addiction module toxin [Limosilactobacillus albertensis]MCD7129211.1 Txe/YoeB family addiction module toxin [Limosilactobacillus albertensis]